MPHQSLEHGDARKELVFPNAGRVWVVLAFEEKLSLLESLHKYKSIEAFGSLRWSLGFFIYRCITRARRADQVPIIQVSTRSRLVSSDVWEKVRNELSGLFDLLGDFIGLIYRRRGGLERRKHVPNILSASSP